MCVITLSISVIMVNSADKIPNEGIEYVQRTKFKLIVIAWKFTMYNVKKEAQWTLCYKEIW